METRVSSVRLSRREAVQRLGNQIVKSEEKAERRLEQKTLQALLRSWDFPECEEKLLEWVKQKNEGVGSEL
ncbi:hypothetical protein MDA_GLEAN10008101 [Myotis davidii]|uniref:Uncharacterized protein n=1 Tax=Myotis davidii TaxID=225400 RepID=L5LW53_MYODS|nr:hypothetical protein MDA_GLEAN10008101 [Myotis davidii]